MYKINAFLATHALGEKGTHPLPYLECETGQFYNGWYIYDVRYLSDLGEDNNLALYRLTINDIINILNHDYYRVVICCGAGQSRSNAIALGVLVHGGDNYYDSLELIKSKVPICHIDPSQLAAIRKLFNVGPP